MSVTHLINEPVWMNYTYTALITYIVRNPFFIKRLLKNKSQIIQACSHSSYEDFLADERRYIFFSNFKLSDYLTAKWDTIGDGEIIMQDQIQINYGYPLTKKIRGIDVPITMHDIIRDPLSTTIYSQSEGTSGSSLYDYAMTCRRSLTSTAKQCPIDLRLVQYDHPVHYISEYDFIAPDGTITKKHSVVCVIKYKNDNNQDYVVSIGTGIREYFPS